MQQKQITLHKDGKFFIFVRLREVFLHMADLPTFFAEYPSNTNEEICIFNTIILTPDGRNLTFADFALDVLLINENEYDNILR